VEQCGWPELQLTGYTHSTLELVCTLTPSPNPIPGTNQDKRRDFFPDFVLIRSEVCGVTVTQDFKNKLLAFMYVDMPSVNSFHSIYHFLERPLIHAELSKVTKRLGDEAFPVIPQNFFPYFRNMMYTNSFPAVLKMGHAHAGYGKTKIANHKDFEDIRSLVALTNCYSTCEPYKQGEYDLRVQKIGPHVRVYKRISISGNWKTNTGSSHVEEIELTDKYRLWAEEAGLLFGGLDICAVDAIHTEDGNEYILEVNGTSSGLLPEMSEEDNGYIRDVTLQRMEQLLFSS